MPYIGSQFERIVSTADGVPDHKARQVRARLSETLSNARRLASGYRISPIHLYRKVDELVVDTPASPEETRLSEPVEPTPAGTATLDIDPAARRNREAAMSVSNDPRLQVIAGVALAFHEESKGLNVNYRARSEEA